MNFIICSLKSRIRSEYQITNKLTIRVHTVPGSSSINWWIVGRPEDSLMFNPESSTFSSYPGHPAGCQALSDLSLKDQKRIIRRLLKHGTVRRKAYAATRRKMAALRG